MSGHRFRLTPIDTWFFRDGRPFEMGALQSDAESLFPPPARTLVGALRLALARGQGYSGHGSWSDAIAKTLGSGPDDLGELSFTGPYLSLDGEMLYPMPLHVVGRWGETNGARFFEPTTFFTPGTNEVQTDLGYVRLPVAKTPALKMQSGEGLYLKREGYEKLLRCELPSKDDAVLRENVFAFEPRIGLQRDAKTRTAIHGHLYRTSHLRLQAGASLVMDVAGVPEKWAKTTPRLISLGGESRMAEVEIENQPKTPIGHFAVSTLSRLTVTLLTPLRLENESLLKGRDVFADWSGVRVISACLGKPIFMGGWDGQNNTTIPLCPYLPAGSTWFCEADAVTQAKLKERSEKGLGHEQRFGFGAVALGTW